MLYALFAVVVGLIGAAADVRVGKVSQSLSAIDWLWTVLSMAAFTLSLVYFMRYGAVGGHRMSIMIALVLAVNIGVFAAWDAFQNSSLSAFEIAGIVLTVAGIVCFELGRR